MDCFGVFGAYKVYPDDNDNLCYYYVQLHQLVVDWGFISIVQQSITLHDTTKETNDQRIQKNPTEIFVKVQYNC